MDKFFQNADHLSKEAQDHLAKAELDMKLQDTLDALTFRHDKELVEMRRRHSHEIRTSSDLSPQQAADLIDQHTQQYDDLREKHDNERNRNIRENDQATRILADMRAQEKQMEIEKRPEVGHDGPNITR